MKPIDYIYKNLDSFNISIFKQIVEESGETPSEDIYDYLTETTWNTNPALLKQFGLDIERSSEDEGESESGVKVIKLAQYGNVPDCYAQDSPWKPTIEELGETIVPIINKYKEQMRATDPESPEMIQLIKVVAQEIDEIVIIYSKTGAQMNAIAMGDLVWVDKTVDQWVNGEIPTEIFDTTQYGPYN